MELSRSSLVMRNLGVWSLCNRPEASSVGWFCGAWAVIYKTDRCCMSRQREAMTIQWKSTWKMHKFSKKGETVLWEGQIQREDQQEWKQGSDWWSRGRAHVAHGVRSWSCPEGWGGGCCLGQAGRMGVLGVCAKGSQILLSNRKELKTNISMSHFEHTAAWHLGSGVIIPCSLSLHSDFFSGIKVGLLKCEICFIFGGLFQ